MAPWDLAEDFGIYEGPSPTKDTPGWTKPKRIVVPAGLMPARLEELKQIAPEVEFIPVRTPRTRRKVVEDADAVARLLHGRASSRPARSCAGFRSATRAWRRTCRTSWSRARSC